MKILKALFVYLVSMQLVFAGKIETSILQNHPQFTKIETEKIIKVVVEKFKHFKTIKDYLKIAHNPNLKTKIKKHESAQASRVIYKDGVIHIRTNHLVTKMTVDLNEGIVTANGKKIYLGKIKDSEDYWNTFENAIREVKTTSVLDYIIPEARAEFILIALAIISFATVVDALVSWASKTQCQKKAKEVLKSLVNVNRQCKEDVASIISTQVNKKDTETARYLQNILNRIDSIRPESFEATSCEEAVASQFENWEIYRFETCMENVPGFTPEVSSKKLCDQIKTTEKCLNEFVEIDPDAITNRNHENQDSDNNQNPTDQGNSSGSHQ